MKEKYLTFANYAKIYKCKSGKIGCHLQYIYKLNRIGKLKTVTIGGKTFVKI